MVLPFYMGELRVLVEFRGYQPRGKRLALTAPVVVEGLADTGAVYTYVTRALAAGGGVLLGHLTMQERRAVLDYRDHSLTCPEPGHPPSDLGAAFDRMAAPRAPRSKKPTAKNAPRSAPARPRLAAMAPTKPAGRGR